MKVISVMTTGQILLLVLLLSLCIASVNSGVISSCNVEVNNVIIKATTEVCKIHSLFFPRNKEQNVLNELVFLF